MKILFHGYFGYGNVGDEAILSALINEYVKRFPSNEIVILSVNPNRSRRLHNVKALREKLSSISFWRELLTSNMLVFTGGGRYGSSTWRRMALLTLLAKLFGKRVIFRSVGVYPYTWIGKPVIMSKSTTFRGVTRFLVKLALQLADFISVRDLYSLAVVKSLSVDKATLEPDPSFNLHIPEPEFCKDVVAKYGFERGRVLGVNLRTLDVKTNKAVVEFVARLVRMFKQEGFSKIVFVPFGFGSFKNRFFDNDLIIATMLKQIVPEMIIVKEELLPLKILCLFNYFDHIIAMRHHAIIFAILAHKPVTAIIYDIKTIELFKIIKPKNINIVLVSDIIGKT